MILVDDRDGSRDLIPLLGELATPCRLDSADVAFNGNGPEGVVTIGVEVKKIPDLLSSEADGRLGGEGGQLQRMRIDYDVVWLLTVGDYRANPNTGDLEVAGRHGWRRHRVGSRGVPIGYLEAFLVELQLGGTLIKQVSTNEEAAGWVIINSRWWNKRWTDHKALRKLNMSGFSMMPGLDPATIQKVKTFQSLPNLGFERALAASRHFPTVEAGIGASAWDWAKVPGIGPVIAQAVYNSIRGV